jgi:hypothetical protein
MQIRMQLFILMRILWSSKAGIRMDPDPHQSDQLDPDPHQSGKLDPDPHPHLQMEQAKMYL